MVKVRVKPLSRVRLFATPWTVAHHAPLSMGFPRPEYWSGFPFPSPVDLPDPGNEPTPRALAGGFFTAEPPGQPKKRYILVNKGANSKILNMKALQRVIGYMYIYIC